MAKDQRSASDLDATELEFLTILWPGDLPEEQIAERLTVEDLSGPPLARRLRVLEKRGLVAFIPAPSGRRWCLTPAGSKVARTLQQGS